MCEIYRVVCEKHIADTIKNESSSVRYRVRCDWLSSVQRFRFVIVLPSEATDNSGLFLC